MRAHLYRLAAAWWSTYPPDRLRVALSILRLLEVSGGRVDIDTHTLSTVLRTSRSTVGRTIEDLVQRGFVHSLPTVGRTGGISVQQLAADWFAIEFTAAIPTDLNAQNHKRTDVQPATGEPFSESIQLRGHQPVLDLSESPQIGSDPSTSGSGRSPSLEFKQNAPGQENPQTKPMIEPTPTCPQPKPKRQRVNPAEISRHAWAAADGLRTRILRFDPSNRLASRPWSGETGDRLAWAYQLDLMVRSDKRGWLEISAVMLWLFPDGVADPVHAPGLSQFVIHSASAFREKFDRVRAAQLRAHTGTKARTGDGRPDPQAAKKLKDWSMP